MAEVLQALLALLALGISLSVALRLLRALVGLF